MALLLSVISGRFDILSEIFIGNVMSSDIQLLKNHHLTVTPQRVEIVRLLSTHGHLDIDTLYALIHENFPSLSLATVYKNINIMLEKNFISEVPLENRKNVYELIKEVHSHVVCTQCNDILDIFLDTHTLFEEVAKISHFQLETSHIVFNGICDKCKVA